MARDPEQPKVDARHRAPAPKAVQSHAQAVHLRARPGRRWAQSISGSAWNSLVLLFPSNVTRRRRSDFHRFYEPPSSQCSLDQSMAAWWKLWGCLGDPRSGTPRTPSICRPHRQLFDRAKAGPPEPTNLIRRDRQFKLLPARKQRLQGARRFDARELMTEAE